MRYLLLVLLAGCTSGHMSDAPRAFKLDDGKVVHCREDWRDECGLRLEDCTDSKSYYCQRNVQRIFE